MKKPVIIVVAIVVLAVGAAVALTLVNKNPETPAANTGTTENTAGNTTSDSSSQTSTTDPSDSTTQAAIITYSDNGFSPSTITVKSGTTVTVKNTSSRDIQFDSDPHPAHTDDKDLNAGAISPGQSTTFVAVNKGTFGYHNHLNPSQTGTIIVQ